LKEKRVGFWHLTARHGGRQLTLCLPFSSKFAGPVISAVKDDKEKSSLVEFKHSADAKYAYDKMNGFKVTAATSFNGNVLTRS
jgi:hypothetical protein